MGSLASSNVKLDRFAKVQLQKPKTRH